MAIIHTTNVPEAEPQTHALVIGVGDYPHLLNGSSPELAFLPMSLGQLTSPIHSATAFTQWVQDELRNPIAPVGTIELLLSPGPYQPAHGNSVEVEAATMSNIMGAFRRWSTRCNKNAANVALFYFCGHGIELGSQVLLASDFGDPQYPLGSNAIDFSTTFRAMVDCAATTQCYFLDACRERPFEALMAHGFTPLALKTGGLSPRLRAAPIISAAPYGLAAHGPQGDTSYFTAALIDCLRGVGAAQFNGHEWSLTTMSLVAAMPHRMKRMRLPDGTRGRCSPSGGEHNLVADLHVFQGDAPVLVDVLCDPFAAITQAQLSAASAAGSRRSRPPAPDPWELDLPSGQWDFEAKFAAAAPAWRDSSLRAQFLHPPYVQKVLRVADAGGVP